MLLLLNIPLSLLGLIPGSLILTGPLQLVINLLTISVGYLLVEAFPDKATPIWTAIFF